MKRILTIGLFLAFAPLSSAQEWSTSTLTRARAELTAFTLGTKAYFVGGYGSPGGNYEQTRIDIYDYLTNSWSVSDMPQWNYGQHTLVWNDKAYLFGGDTALFQSVDINGQWSDLNTSGADMSRRFGVGYCSHDGKIYVAGGDLYPWTFSNRTDAIRVYDIETDQWATDLYLSEEKVGVSVSSVGSKILFAGGFKDHDCRSVVDIYNTATDTWTQANMQSPRGYMAVARIGTKVIFAGGQTQYSDAGNTSNSIDIYDDSDGSWSTADLSLARSEIAVTISGSKVFFAGGRLQNEDGATEIDIYDDSTGVWSVAHLSVPRYNLGVTSVGSKAVFAGGRIDYYNDSPSSVIDIYYGGPDCNSNGVPDPDDLLFNNSADCDGNGIPDECQLATEQDCNGNGVLDICDIASGISEDCDNNGVMDICEEDCNSNGVADTCEIFNGTSDDCNSNGLLDECDLINATSVDCNLNGVPDECDLLSGELSDCNTDGVPDLCQEIDDCNGDGVPDECTMAEDDCNGNGTLDVCEGIPDCDADGIPDTCEISSGSAQDSDANGVPDDCECSNANYCSTSPNSVGAGVLIDYSGSLSVTANDLVLTASGGPHGQPGIFFYGSQQSSQPFGNGVRCVGGLTFRIYPPASYFNSAGNVTKATNYNAGSMATGLGRIEPGSVFNFQFWYRDPTAGGSTFNLSDAMSLTFCL